MDDDRFLGRRVLSGVWMTEYSEQQYMRAMDGGQYYSPSRYANVCLILLDGQIWRFMEDPDDGYRSLCHEPQLVTDVFPINWWQTSERVHGYHVEFAPTTWAMDEREWECGQWWLPGWRQPPEDPNGTWVTTEKCDYLVLVSEVTNKPVLIVGTSDADDYYPSFVAHFEPENMSVNSEQRGLIDIAGVEGEKDA